MAEKTVSEIRRRLNGMKDSDLLTRKKSVTEVRQIIEDCKLDMSSQAMDQLLLEYSKMLIQCFADPSEKVREISIDIYVELVSRYHHLT